MRWKAFLLTFALMLASSYSLAQNPKYIENLERLINRAHETPKEEEKAEDIEPDDLAIEAILNRAGQAFESGDASDLERLVVGRRKVYLSLEAGGKEPDHYGTSQLKFIFEEIFQEVRTGSFVYDSRDIERYNGIAVARADWTYTVVAEDEDITEHLQLKLEKDETSWRIFEIRAASR